MLNKIVEKIATLWFIGFIPIAPGTFGTLSAFLCVYYIQPSENSLIICICFLFITGIIASQSAEKTLGKQDSRHIVIDEFTGYLISIIFLKHTLGVLVAAFWLFRFFDIFKPPPIRRIDRNVKGGLGVMLDDVVAGIFTNIILQILT